MQSMIRVSEKTKGDLFALKRDNSETFDKVIRRLIERRFSQNDLFELYNKRTVCDDKPGIRKYMEADDGEV